MRRPRSECVEEQIVFIQSEMSEYECENEAEEEVDISLDESLLGEPSQIEVDDYNLFVSVAVTETETDEVDNEFVEAVVEIEGKKSFQCEQCGKVCKSKGGLTRHTNSKHGKQGSNASGETAPLDKETVDGFVEAIKTRIIDEDIYGSATNATLTTVSSTEALFDALLPLYETFRRKKSQDKLLESFYGLIPRSCEFFKCEDYKIANLIMIQLPDFLVGFFNRTSNRQNISNETPEQTSAGTPQLNPAEHGPLSYIAGYIVSKLHQTNKNKKGESNEEIQALLQVMKSTDTTNNFISARTRGGLISPCDDLVSILKVAELSFRSEVGKTKETLRSIPTEYICNSVLDSPVVKSLWENIVLSSGIELSSPTQKLFLENVVKLYLKVRSFSYARDYITKYNIKEKQTKSKALRKDLKKASAEK